MKFRFKDKTFSFPSTLSEITLGQKIEYENKYGKELDNKYKKIIGEEALNKSSKKNIDNDASLEKEKVLTPIQELELTELQIDIACKNFSFFTGIPLEDVKNINIDQVLNVYYSCFEQLNKEEDMKLEDKYLWNNEYWYLNDYKTNHTSDTTFNEFITAKQIVKNFYDLGEGKWDSLPYLCAIFLRKEGESFDEKLIVENSERIKLMYGLPLNIALSVAFFLSVSMIIYMNRLVYSMQQQEVRDQT
ncbi:hypothetical protein ETU09_05825 [Apibacter muscae]|uniref:Uncharacterized protein n=1 Tax=Apibacter muscae TaxID=2509004 RepID=A0A563DE85_9FLAO|nr:hypothetical protein [Apibacter muscae]TWP28442.1 hypothetical protein ETU09_05825 [Apibacter muscae]